MRLNFQSRQLGGAILTLTSGNPKPKFFDQVRTELTGKYGPATKVDSDGKVTRVVAPSQLDKKSVTVSLRMNKGYDGIHLHYLTSGMQSGDEEMKEGL